jgi:hypothetical protein
MRDKLIEICLDFVEVQRNSRNSYSAEELHRFTNEYLLELIEEFLDESFSRFSALKEAKRSHDYDHFEKPEMGWLNVTAIDNTYSEDVGGALADDVLFGGNHPSDWDGGDADKYAMPAFDFNPFKAREKKEDTDNISTSLYNYNIGSD